MIDDQQDSGLLRRFGQSDGERGEGIGKFLKLIEYRNDDKVTEVIRHFTRLGRALEPAPEVFGKVVRLDHGKRSSGVIAFVCFRNAK